MAKNVIESNGISDNALLYNAQFCFFHRIRELKADNEKIILNGNHLNLWQFL